MARPVGRPRKLQKHISAASPEPDLARQLQALRLEFDRNSGLVDRVVAAARDHALRPVPVRGPFSSEDRREAFWESYHRRHEAALDLADRLPGLLVRQASQDEWLFDNIREVFRERHYRPFADLRGNGTAKRVLAGSGSRRSASRGTGHRSTRWTPMPGARDRLGTILDKDVPAWMIDVRMDSVARLKARSPELLRGLGPESVGRGSLAATIASYANHVRAMPAFLRRGVAPGVEEVVDGVLGADTSLRRERVFGLLDVFPGLLRLDYPGEYPGIWSALAEFFAARDYAAPADVNKRNPNRGTGAGMVKLAAIHDRSVKWEVTPVDPAKPEYCVTITEQPIRGAKAKVMRFLVGLAESEGKGRPVTLEEGEALDSLRQELGRAKRSLRRWLTGRR